MTYITYLKMVETIYKQVCPVLEHLLGLEREPDSRYCSNFDVNKCLRSSSLAFMDRFWISKIMFYQIFDEIESEDPDNSDDDTILFGTLKRYSLSTHD